MEFPITDLLDAKACEQWLLAHVHPAGVRCRRCGAGSAEAHPFRRTRKSKLPIYRGTGCHQIYNLYSGTIVQPRHLTPRQGVLLVRGRLKGEPSKTLAGELGLHDTTVLEVRPDRQDPAPGPSD